MSWGVIWKPKYNNMTIAAQIRAVLMVVLINFHRIIKTIQATINVIIITLGIGNKRQGVLTGIGLVSKIN